MSLVLEKLSRGPPGSILHPYRGWTGGHTLVTITAPLHPQVSSWVLTHPVSAGSGQSTGRGRCRVPSIPDVSSPPCRAGEFLQDPVRQTWGSRAASVPSEPREGLDWLGG